MFTLGRFPELFETLSQLSVHVLGDCAVLRKRDRQLAILRTAWLLGAPFELGEHVVIARMLGIAREDIDAITTGSQAPGWSERDRTMLHVAEELRAAAFVSDATWAALRTGSTTINA